MVDALEIGFAIKDRRAELGLTQAQVAEAAGVSSRCLWSLELGLNPGVQLNKLTAVLKVLGLDLCLREGEVPDSKSLEQKQSVTPTIPFPCVQAQESASNDVIDAFAILTRKKKRNGRK
ncbi:MAG: helix-turn-helix domain-containing protein [Eggerthellaceae bacterium]